MTNLKIVSIKASSISSRVNLELSDSRVFILLADDIYLLNLSKGLDLDDVLYGKIVDSSITLLLRDYALRQVSISPKNKHILLPKLKLNLKKIILKYSFPNNNYQHIIQKIITLLEDKKYLSDTDLANYLIRRYSKKSPMYISQILSKAGLKQQDYIEQLPSSINQIEEIKRLINKKTKTSLDLEDKITRQKIIAYIYRKGFSLSNINRSIDEIRYNG